MSSQVDTKYGSIVFNDRVIANIVCSAAMETYGIVGLAAKNTKDGIYELLGIETMTRGVNIYSNDGESIVIEISVIVEYGTRISVVADNLIEKIRYTVESRTGLQVDSVNLIVRGIRS